ncbi:hypothetical protein Ccrd_019393 [Cynara cardunculus var. scolymus]|uniref:Uncharacterized protein n=1 Tax=Cynara cardunculus var. scolymus TaxID=59895 RepID=A0A103Y4E6_CYNCS|nr:hypothetical protein Ccrd_019393 [Cynara cardunculus var. scolymus]
MDSAGAGYGNMKKFAVVEYYSKVIWNYHHEEAAQKQQPRLAANLPWRDGEYSLSNTVEFCCIPNL